MNGSESCGNINGDVTDLDHVVLKNSCVGKTIDDDKPGWGTMADWDIEPQHLWRHPLPDELVEAAQQRINTNAKSPILHESIWSSTDAAAATTSGPDNEPVLEAAGEERDNGGREVRGVPSSEGPNLVSGRGAFDARIRLLKLYDDRSNADLVSLIIYGNIIPKWAALEILIERNDHHDYMSSIQHDYDIYMCLVREFQCFNNKFQLACCGCEWVQWLAMVALDREDELRDDHIDYQYVDAVTTREENIKNARRWQTQVCVDAIANINWATAFDPKNTDFEDFHRVLRRSVHNPESIFLKPLLNVELRRTYNCRNNYTNQPKLEELLSEWANMGSYNPDLVPTTSFKYAACRIFREMYMMPNERAYCMFFNVTGLTWPLVGVNQVGDNSTTVDCFITICTILVTNNIVFMDDGDVYDYLLEQH
jgi:hypothetical protein